MEADEPVQFDQSYVRLVLMWLASNNRSGVADFTKPHIKPSLRYVYPLFVFLYILVMLAGTAGWSDCNPLTSDIDVSSDIIWTPSHIIVYIQQ